MGHPTEQEMIQSASGVFGAQVSAACPPTWTGSGRARGSTADGPWQEQPASSPWSSWGRATGLTPPCGCVSILSAAGRLTVLGVSKCMASAQKLLQPYVHRRGERKRTEGLLTRP